MFDYYFKPKRFEKLKGKSIYRYLGVDFFKKHLLLTDFILFRIQKKSQIHIGEKGRANEIKRLEWQTRRDETIHLVFMCIIAAIVILKSENISPAQWVAIFFINLYTNVYPIFLQRHNRMRLMRLLQRL